jgi:hypothetical protein
VKNSKDRNIPYNLLKIKTFVIKPSIRFEGGSDIPMEFDKSPGCWFTAYSSFSLCPLDRLFVIILILFSSLTVSVPSLLASDTSSLDFEPHEQAQHLKKNHTFRLERSFRHPASDTLVRFLFEKLDVNAATVRGWHLLDLHASRIDTRIYRVRVGNRMEGTTYKLGVESGRARYVGQGIYRQDYLPFAIEGAALMDLEWNPLPDTAAVKITATLRLRPTSEVLHLIGTLLHPVAKSALHDALDRVIDIGRSQARIIRKHPTRTTERLRRIDEAYARTWNDFRKENFNPGF